MNECVAADWCKTGDGVQLKSDFSEIRPFQKRTAGDDDPLTPHNVDSRQQSVSEKPIYGCRTPENIALYRIDQGRSELHNLTTKEHSRSCDSQANHRGKPGAGRFQPSAMCRSRGVDRSGGISGPQRPTRPGRSQAAVPSEVSCGHQSPDCLGIPSVYHPRMI